jgi:hypothetical protein
VGAIRGTVAVGTAIGTGARVAAGGGANVGAGIAVAVGIPAVGPTATAVGAGEAVTDAEGAAEGADPTELTPVAAKDPALVLGAPLALVPALAGMLAAAPTLAGADGQTFSATSTTGAYVLPTHQPAANVASIPAATTTP